MITKQQVEKLPRSIKRYIREEKGRIRREFLSEEKRREEIHKVYERFVQTAPQKSSKKKAATKGKSKKKSTK